MPGGETSFKVHDWSSYAALYGRRVWLAIVALGVAPDRAHDVAQEVWMKLMKQAEQGALPTVEMPGLALAQARFAALDELRRVKAAAASNASEAQSLPDERDPQRIAIAREGVERARAALVRCSAREEEVFRLAFVDSLPHAAIADRVGLSVQRVRQILCEVRKRLKAELEDR
jgi:RNA polymerase sigma-70 factor (ECF subfamily)